MKIRELLNSILINDIFKIKYYVYYSTMVLFNIMRKLK